MSDKILVLDTEKEYRPRPTECIADVELEVIHQRYSGGSTLIRN